LGILLLDTSAKISGFGYADKGELIFTERTDPGVNADKLTFYIKSSFDKHRLKFSEIECVSLSNGPGSFTGLRIGSAIAKGICFATGCRLIEINTLDITANKFGSSGKVTSLIFSNTRNSEFYYCRYVRNEDVLKRVSDYQKGTEEEIFTNEDENFVINVSDSDSIIGDIRKKITDVSEHSAIESQLKLTLTEIQENRFSDYKTSQPYYMNEFIPKI
jgi:tRNA threonylcarbamoyl adenosine modification protein YeaZ